jgi:hypothetical protein
MSKLRGHLVILLAGVVILAGCGRPDHAGLPPDVRRELASGRYALNGWIAQSRSGGLPSDEVAIALGYAERLRLGLGSPFRLVETALRDPRLSAGTRDRLAWALLARTVSGDAFEIDAVSLDRAGAGQAASWPGLGVQHLRLIQSVVTESRDPRGGELAVRLAYRLAVLEGSLPPAAPRLAAHAAALVRDREVARQDAIRLLRSAEVAAGDPLRAIGRWRSERWFRVEAPVLETLPPEVEREAAELAPKLVQALRLLAPRLADALSARPAALPAVRPSLLEPAVAARLAVLSDSLNMPPRAPVAIALRAYVRELEHAPWLDADERERRRVLLEASDEERFVAALAQLERRSPFDAAPSLVALRAAVGLRAYAQAAVWFPGSGGPTARELEERFGFAYVRFADHVPAAWRPYFRGVLASAVLDMQRVMPALELRGLGVRFAPARAGTATLALHDPRARELLLPPGTAAGTLAHEIAHDLDWQVALRHHRVRGDYASDRAVRAAAGRPDRADRADQSDRFAARVRSLAPGPAVEAAGDEQLDAHMQRPAENFARAVDWYVAVALAGQGRSNGYLTAIQDGVLTGHGTARPPDIAGRAGDAIIGILDQVAPLYPETRDAFLRRYGSGRSLGAYDLLRSIAEAQLPDAGVVSGSAAAAHGYAADPVFSAIASARTRALAAIDDWICRAPAGAHDSRLEHARRSLAVEGAAARARGVAVQRARLFGGDAGMRWVAHRFSGVPWPGQELDGAVADLLDELVRQARELGVVAVRRTAPGFELMSSSAGQCPALGPALAVGRHGQAAAGPASGQQSAIPPAHWRPR